MIDSRIDFPIAMIDDTADWLHRSIQPTVGRQKCNVWTFHTIRYRLGNDMKVWFVCRSCCKMVVQFVNDNGASNASGMLKMERMRVFVYAFARVTSFYRFALWLNRITASLVANKVAYWLYECNWICAFCAWMCEKFFWVASVLARWSLLIFLTFIVFFVIFSWLNLILCINFDFYI